MKRIRAAAICAAAASAATPAMAIDAQQMTVNQSVVLTQGAMAAFAVDPTIVDASVDAGRVVLRAGRRGDTVVTVILAGSIESIRVHVDPAVLAFDPETARTHGATMLEGSYDSSLKRLTGVVSGRGRVGEFDIRIYAETLRQFAPQEGEVKMALPSATVEISSGERSIVLLDQYVRGSPFTLDNVVLRGVHLKEGDFEFHGGIASWSPLEGFLGAGGERAATASYAFTAGGLRVTPRLAWFPGNAGNHKGTAAVTLEFNSLNDALHVRADGGLGPSPAVAVDADYRTQQRQVRVRGSIRPDGFAGLRSSQSPGRYAEGSWTENLNDSTSLAADGSATRIQFAQHSAQSSAARIELMQRLSPQWSATLSSSAGAAQSDASSELRRSTIGAGIAWDLPQWGVGAQYRHQQVSGASSAGHGGRLSVRGAMGGFSANAYVDAQQQAPTLDLVFDERSSVARTLASLGIVAAQPEDLLRALSENAGLLNDLNLAIGPVRLNPLRMSAGGSLDWHGTSEARPEIGARFMQENVRGVLGARSSAMVSLHAAWRFSDHTDARVTASHWAVHKLGQPATASNSLQFSVRTFIDGALITSSWSKAVSGQVFRTDPQAEGDDAMRTPLAGVDVVLDHSRRTRTDSQGRYQFDGPGPGAHSIEAILPQLGDAYFTSASTIEREAGGNADFGIALLGVRVSGTVLSDAGRPLVGVALHAEGSNTLSAVTDSSGGWRMTLPPGEVRVSIVPDSLPAGYDLRALSARSRTLVSREPAKIDFSVRALRSVEGVVTGLRAAGSTVTALELGRSVTADAQGRFIIRQLPAGSVTLVVGQSQSKSARLVVTLPDDPKVVRGVTLEAAP